MCVMPIYLDGLKTVALTVRQQQQAAGLREQLGQEDYASGGDLCAYELDGEISEMPAEIGWTLGADVGRDNGKESGQVEGTR